MIARRGFTAGLGSLPWVAGAVWHGLADAQPGTQRDWRHCGKCHVMFFDGFPGKGACPAGAGHQAAGLEFVLTHDVAGSGLAQPGWRYCAKCSSMFFDGFADKGACRAGGAHVARGFVFVLPHEAEPFVQALDSFWRAAGRGIVSENLRTTLNGHHLAKGVSVRNANPHLGEIDPSWRRTGPASLVLELKLLGSNVEFKTTTPTILGSYADPAFRVGFDMLLTLRAAARAGAPFLSLEVVEASISRASIHGSNAAGTVIETVGDLFSRGAVSRMVTEKLNGNQEVRQLLQQEINKQVARLPGLVMP